MTVSDENASPYLNRTLSTFYPNHTLNATEFKLANKFHAINGLVHAAPKDLIIKKNSTLWHLLGWGTFVDVQYVKWEHGSLNLNGENVNHVRLMPASFKTATVQLDQNGKFAFGSLDNKTLGMVMTYSVDL